MQENICKFFIVNYKMSEENGSKVNLYGDVEKLRRMVENRKDKMGKVRHLMSLLQSTLKTIDSSPPEMIEKFAEDRGKIQETYEFLKKYLDDKKRAVKSAKAGTKKNQKEAKKAIMNEMSNQLLLFYQRMEHNLQNREVTNLKSDLQLSERYKDRNLMLQYLEKFSILLETGSGEDEYILYADSWMPNDFRQLPIQNLIVSSYIREMSVYPNSLVKLYFKNFMNRILYLPDVLYTLSISDYNFELMRFPRSVKFLQLINYKNQIPAFPLILKELYIEEYQLGGFQFPTLPESLEILTIKNYKGPLPKIPGNVKSVSLFFYEGSLPDLPDELQKLELRYCKLQINRFPDRLRYLTIYALDGKIPKLPDSVKRFTMDGEVGYEKKIYSFTSQSDLKKLLLKYSIKYDAKTSEFVLSADSEIPENFKEINIEKLKIGTYRKNIQSLPFSVKELSIEYFPHKIDSFPPDLEYLSILSYKQPLPNFPMGLKVLKIEKYDITLPLLPNRLEELYLKDSKSVVPTLKIQKYEGELPDDMEFISIQLYDKRLNMIPLGILKFIDDLTFKVRDFEAPKVELFEAYKVLVNYDYEKLRYIFNTVVYLKQSWFDLIYSLTFPEKKSLEEELDEEKQKQEKLRILEECKEMRQEVMFRDVKQMRENAEKQKNILQKKLNGNETNQTSDTTSVSGQFDARNYIPHVKVPYVGRVTFVPGVGLLPMDLGDKIKEYVHGYKNGSNAAGDTDEVKGGGSDSSEPGNNKARAVLEQDKVHVEQIKRLPIALAYATPEDKKPVYFMPGSSGIPAYVPKDAEILSYHDRYWWGSGAEKYMNWSPEKLQDEMKSRGCEAVLWHNDFGWLLEYLKLIPIYGQTIYDNWNIIKAAYDTIMAAARNPVRFGQLLFKSEFREKYIYKPVSYIIYFIYNYIIGMPVAYVARYVHKKVGYHIDYYEGKTIQLPLSLKKLVLENYSGNIRRLPNHLDELWLIGKISYVPLFSRSVKVIYIRDLKKGLEILPSFLKILTVEQYAYNLPALPAKLKSVNLTNYSGKIPELTESIVSVQFVDCKYFYKVNRFPDSITKIFIKKTFSNIPPLPLYVHEVELIECPKVKFASYPPSLKILKIDGKDYGFEKSQMTYNKYTSFPLLEKYLAQFKIFYDRDKDFFVIDYKTLANPPEDFGKLPITHLMLKNSDCALSSFPNTLIHLIVQDYKFYLPNIDVNLKKFEVKNYTGSLPILNKGLESLTLEMYSGIIPDIPNSVQILKVSDPSYELTNIPQNINSLSLVNYPFQISSFFVQSIREMYLENIQETLPDLPEYLVTLSINTYNGEIPILPKGIKNLTLKNFTADLMSFPSELKTLHLDTFNGTAPSFPISLVSLTLVNYIINEIPAFPPHLQELIIKKSAPVIPKIPPSVKIYILDGDIKIKK